MILPARAFLAGAVVALLVACAGPPLTLYTLNVAAPVAPRPRAERRRWGPGRW